MYIFQHVIQSLVPSADWPDIDRALRYTETQSHHTSHSPSKTGWQRTSSSKHTWPLKSNASIRIIDCIQTDFLTVSKTVILLHLWCVCSRCVGVDPTELDAATDAEQRRRHVVERQRHVDSVTGASATQTQESHAHHRFDVTDPSSLRQPWGTQTEQQRWSC